MTVRGAFYVPVVTIAIPTLNRAPKAKRLLRAIQDEVRASGLEDRVAVIVSDNASSDDTPSAVQEFLGSDLNVQYHRQPENLGFDGNLRFLYTRAATPYVWFMADDDLPLKGAIARVVGALETQDPDVLLFSFIQPPGSTVRTFDFPEAVKVITEPVSAIQCVIEYPKVSIYVLRKVDFSSRQWGTLDRSLGDGWYHILFALSVLECSSQLKLAVISEPLATCDEDYFRMAWTPKSVLKKNKMVEHPFVLRHQPHLPRLYRDRGYCSAIQFAFEAKVGSLVPQNMHDYDLFIRNLEWRMPVLLKAPRAFCQLLAIKLGIAWVWPKMRGVREIGRRLIRSPRRPLNAGIPR